MSSPEHVPKQSDITVSVESVEPLYLVTNPDSQEQTQENLDPNHNRVISGIGLVTLMGVAAVGLNAMRPRVDNNDTDPLLDQSPKINPIREAYYANRVRKWSKRVREAEFQARKPLNGHQLRKAQERGAIAASRRMGAGFDNRQHKKADRLSQLNSEQLVNARARASGEGGLLSRWKLQRVVRKADKYGVPHSLRQPRR